MRRQEEADMEHGDLDVKSHIEKWVQSSKREQLRGELRVII